MPQHDWNPGLLPAWPSAVRSATSQVSHRPQSLNSSGTVSGADPSSGGYCQDAARMYQRLRCSARKADTASSLLLSPAPYPREGCPWALPPQFHNRQNEWEALFLQNLRAACVLAIGASSLLPERTLWWAELCPQRDLEES